MAFVKKRSGFLRPEPGGGTFTPIEFRRVVRFRLVGFVMVSVLPSFW